MKLKFASTLALLILTLSLAGCFPWDKALKKAEGNEALLGEIRVKLDVALEKGIITEETAVAVNARLDKIEADNTETIEDAEAAEEEDVVGNILRIAGMAGLPGMPLVGGLWEMGRRRKNKAESMAAKATNLAEAVIRSIKLSTNPNTGVVDWKKVGRIQAAVDVEEDVAAILSKHKKEMAAKDIAEGNGVT